MKLTYNKSKVYPDNSSIEWIAASYHDGYVDNKLRFRVINPHHGFPTKERILQMLDANNTWQVCGTFHEATLFYAIKDKEEAIKYDHYHSLHSCHQLAEDLLEKKS